MRENPDHNALISSQPRAHQWVVEQWVVQGLAMVEDLELDRAVCELTDFESAHLKPAEWEEPVLSPRDGGWTGREEDGWRLTGARVC